jgi:hypothetical protein
MSQSPDAARDLLRDAFGRIAEGVPDVVDGLSDDELLWRPDAASNHVAWLLWHLTRQHDAQVADLAGAEQVWRSGGWAERFALPFGPGETGYGFDADQVGRVRVGAELLTGYLDAVQVRTVDFLDGLSGADLDRVVDDAWDPPVTLGVRLVSVLDDDLEHAAQAAFVRGVLERR